MKRRCGKCGKLGLLILLAGVLVILALVLPPGFWIFLAGVGLIAAGILMLRR